MPCWNEDEFIRRAQDIAQRHVVSKKSINELSEKVATDENLNPEEIRTLVRLANVETFREMFKQKTGSDRMIEFDVGDPETVIRHIADAANNAPRSASVDNDKLAAELPDMMREKRLGFKFDTAETTKEASAEEAARAPRKDSVLLALEKLASEFGIEQYSADHAWASAIRGLTHSFKVASRRETDLESFEKDAFSEYGLDAVPEITALRAELKRSPLQVDPVKVSQLQERHVAMDTEDMRLLKIAVEARARWIELERGMKWIKENKPVL